jgi:hypothetical protein
VKSGYDLGKDMVFTDSNSRILDNFDLAWNARKDIIISRYRYEDSAKMGEIVDVQIAIE